LQLVFFLIRTEPYGGEIPVWLGLENKGSTNCSGVSCVGKLTWSDGSALTATSPLVNAIQVIPAKSSCIALIRKLNWTENLVGLCNFSSMVFIEIWLWFLAFFIISDHKAKSYNILHIKRNTSDIECFCYKRDKSNRTHLP
jgi:hypothetical protein